MKHIGILGSFGSGNLGDEAAWISVKQFLMEKNPRYKYHTQIFNWGQPHMTCGYHSNHVYFLSGKEIEWINENFSALIITGGGIIGWKWGLTKTKRVAEFLGKLTIPIYTISISAESGTYDEEALKVVETIYKKSKFFTVRDTISQKAMEELGYDGVEITPDIVTVMKSAADNTSMYGEMKEVIISTATNCIDEHFLKFWKSICEEIGKDRITYACYQPTETEIMAKILATGDIKVNLFTPTEMQMLMKRTNVVIAGRLHAAVFAANAGVPFFAINYHPKVKSFCDKIGWPYYYPKENPSKKDETEYGVDYSQLNVADFLAQFTQFVKTQPPIPKVEENAYGILNRVWDDMNYEEFEKPVEGTTIIAMTERNTDIRTMKTNCMYCGEEINLGAEKFHKCKHCKNVNQNENV